MLWFTWRPRVCAGSILLCACWVIVLLRTRSPDFVDVGERKIALLVAVLFVAVTYDTPFPATSDNRLRCLGIKSICGSTGNRYHA